MSGAVRTMAALAAWATLAAVPARTLAAAPIAAAEPTEARSLAWDEAFASPGDAGDVHAVARYRGGDGAWHRLELWRRGDASVHRRTDDRVDLYVRRDDRAAGELRFQVRDARRGTLIEVDRANLFRIGVFSDWGSLAHLLRPPASPVSVTRVSGPASPVDPDCESFRVVPRDAAAGPAHEVCWSARWGLPLRVTRLRADGSPEPVLEVQEVGSGTPQDPGFGPPGLAADGAFVDANADIDPAAD